MRLGKLLISIGTPLAILAAACGSAAAEPTAVPPTSTPAPTPVPRLKIIAPAAVNDIEGFLAQMPEADVACLTSSVGPERFTALVSGAELEDSERDGVARCFSNQLVLGVLAGQIQAGLGSFSGSSLECVISLMDELPEGVMGEVLVGQSDNPSPGAAQGVLGFVECLTAEEVGVLGFSDQGAAADDPSSPGYLEPDDDSRAAEVAARARLSLLQQCLNNEFGEKITGGLGNVSAVLVDIFTSVITACDTDTEFDGLLAKLADPGRVYTLQDLESTGFKKNKSYDVTGLDAAVEAHYGFYGTDVYKRLEYEVRLYPSHAEAITSGVDFADEATGIDAVLSEDEQRWDVGLKERRQCTGVGGHNSGLCNYPKYVDYVVVGNMVLLCEGKEPTASLLACADLLRVVD
ncbi:MAG: hypothetical protein O3B95_11985 [Chloroflexi bacterium]|nr:hypothetical protein [Chloroflexota bacterium]